MKIKLTKEQNKHYESIKWLFSGARGSGRTTLLAYALIENVLEARCQRRIFDHYGDTRADMNLMNLIEQLVIKYALPIKIDHSRITMSFNEKAVY
jgi:hypothetical protein